MTKDPVRTFARNLYNVLYLLTIFTFVYSGVITNEENFFQTDLSRGFASLTFIVAILIALFLSGTFRAEGFDYTAIVVSSLFLALTWYGTLTPSYLLIGVLAVWVISLWGYVHPNWLYNLISKKK
ncbi:hypothetical protein M1545_02985 [Patescibacteria group bacterium]|nr:hypothetical protein [Patescibacteria group bacterium]